ncbi:MAG: hypothetical protein R3C13_06435 [Hyphomonas sp.]|uniref:hypothetical protein n=1 Tax=Hyphomonas sp. TaxID=87 RepID=UPI003528E38A
MSRFPGKGPRPWGNLLPLVLIVAAPAGYAWWAHERPTGYESGLQPAQGVPFLLVCMLPFAVRMLWARFRRV